MFSATMTEEVEQFISDYFNTPQKIEAAPTGTPLENINQNAFQVPNFNTKVNLLTLLLEKQTEMKKVMVFTSSKQIADLIFDRIESKFPNQLGVIHSNKSQNNRFMAVQEFKNGNYRVLIATDIIARGLDVSEVTHVINFDAPDEPENYMHRIGRSGRADKKGEAITFFTEKDEERYEAIEALMNRKITLLDLPEGLEISDVLIEGEIPSVKMKEIRVKTPKREEAGPAFHEKSEKNKKVNNKIRRAEAHRIKYGKSKSVRGKKKK